MLEGSTGFVLDRGERWTANRIGCVSPSGMMLSPRLRRQYLPPGQLVVCADPCAVTTIVGSCVAVCLMDRVARVGGMNHYILPFKARNDDCLRYGAVAIPRLIDGVLAMGGRRDRLEAKVFGGASVVGALCHDGDHLGSRNVRLARQILSENGIPIIAEDVNGDRGRKVFFQSDEGTAWVRKL
jgi:chemotaxis protein CheD